MFGFCLINYCMLYIFVFVVNETKYMKTHFLFQTSLKEKDNGEGCQQI